MKGAVREQWGKLTDNDLEQIAGKKDQLIGRIQERYGISRDVAKQQADQWAQTVQTEEPVGHGHGTQGQTSQGQSHAARK
jgi:uncharacterized protein YjbJ (UPF0337 family)